MRSYLVMIKEAELLCRTPEGVYEWLKDHAARTTAYTGELDDSADLALLGRNEPLVDFALARFTRNAETAKALMSKTKDRGPLDFKARGTRLAVLSNEYVGLQMSAMPGLLFSDHYEGVIDFLKTADEPELCALFGNRSLSEKFIEDFLLLKAPWTALDEHRQFVAGMALARNPRMRQKYDGPMDGYAEYTHNTVFHAAWGLAETAPVNRDWAHFLADLLDGMPESWNQKDPMPVLERWHPPLEEVKTVGVGDVDDVARSGYLGIYQMVRQAIAQAALENGKFKLSEMLTSDDPAIRAAGYAKGKMSPEQITAAYERDKNLAVNSMQSNVYLWRYERTRAALRRASWDISSYNNSYLDSANAYDQWEAKHRKENPDWFADEHDNPEDVSINGDNLEPRSESRDIRASMDALPAISQSLTQLHKRLSWVWWFALGGLVIAFAKH